MEARVNRHRNTRSQVADCLNPIRGIRDRQRRAGKEPTDFARKHRDALRQMQDKNRDIKCKEEENTRRAKTHRFTLEKFKNVNSRLYSPTQSTAAAAAEAAGMGSPRQEIDATASPRSKSNEDNKNSPGGERGLGSARKYLAKGSGRSRHAAVSLPGQTTPRKFVRQAVPGIALKAACPEPGVVGHLKKRVDKDYLGQNFRAARKAGHGRVEKEKSEEDRRVKETKKRLSRVGKTPAYLRRRKAELAKAKAEELAARPDEDCPPGMKLLPEEERVATLQLLKKTQGEHSKSLDMMPLAVSTPGQIRRKNEVEAKLREIEEAIRIFSKKKVFIRME